MQFTSLPKFFASVDDKCHICTNARIFMPDREEIKDWFTALQKDICHQLEHADEKGKFQSDEWARPGGGGGISRVLTNGAIIEKGGVNFSAVWGPTPEPVLKSMQVDAQAAGEFFATGVSIVIHPFNPMVPIIHMNVRYFEMSDGTWWFGGGIDLTPHYIIQEDAVYFHDELKKICDKHHPTYYPEFKKWADDYFYIKHRQETRGIGGIFFDHLKGSEEFSKEKRLAFVKEVGLSFARIYTQLMRKNHVLPFSQREKEWQYLRRGRYVEFNLVWDRGTKFGLDTDGRTESILMSLPPQANWTYNYMATENSPEQHTLDLLKKGINWLR